MLEGMFACVSNVSFDGAAIANFTRRVHVKAIAMGEFVTYDMAGRVGLARTSAALRAFCCLACAAWQLMRTMRLRWAKDVSTVTAFLYEGMRAMGEDLGADELLPLVLKCGEVNLTAMAILEEANVGAYGKPEPAAIELKVEAGPFIVVTGHDLHDLKQLLEQTEGRDVNVYTHGEMLPANAYPELRKYPI